MIEIRAERERVVINENAHPEVRPMVIVSGGQTGVDRAALDAAAFAGVARGGWCPRGRRAEDGPIPASYPLKETPSESYEERTRWNVRDSDGTLVLVSGPCRGGTEFTVAEAKRIGRPLLCMDPDRGDVEAVSDWLGEHDIRTLNVAGPRETPAGRAYASAFDFMVRLLAR